MIHKKSLATYKYIPKSGHIWKRLPRVPMTQYLETQELNTDIMYNGYRPVTYPVKENPLFRHKKNQTSIMQDFFVREEPSSSSSSSSSTSRSRKEDNKYLYGEDNHGGIHTLGVNGTWKYGPKVPPNLLPFNWWSVSSVGMQYYPEWNAIPKEIISKLKPFDRG